jgi:phosphoribosylglycinamide formyltransferase-1
MSLSAVGILISGSGSNMVALVKAIEAGEVPARAAVVVSNNPQAAGLAKAQALGVPTAVVDHRACKGDREAFDAAIDARLREAGAEIVACAGFMRIMTPVLTSAWAGALEAGVCVHGATVHEVTQDLDSGAILGQAVVPVEAGDTTETLAARVLRREHVLYPRVLAAFIRDPDAARRNPIAIFPDADTHG